MSAAREQGSLNRAVFSDGRYPDLFRPDAPENPFRNLYAAKRHDILTIVRSRPGSRVLDLGGGPGRIAVPLARDRTVTLADVSAEMLERAAGEGRAAGLAPDALILTRLDAADPFPFASGSFDVAIAVDLLVLLPDPVATLRELRRVLAPGGVAVVDTTNRRPHWMLRYPAYVGRRPRRWLRTWRAGGVLPEWTGIVTHHSREEFHRMLEEAGLRIVEERAYGPRVVPKWMLAVCEAAAPSGAGPRGHDRSGGS